MADGEIKTHRIGIGFDPCGYDIVDRMSEIFARVIGSDFEAADDEACEAVQFARALKVPEHAIDAIEVFPGVFHEENFAGGIDIGPCAGEGLYGFQVTADQL